MIDEDLPRTGLFELINQDKLHLQFLKENDMCTGNDKVEIVNEVEQFFGIISGRSCKGDEKDNDSSNNKRRMSN